MQQAIRRERVQPRPPLRVGTGAGLLLIALISTLVTLALNPSSLVASSRVLAPSMAALSDLVGGRAAARVQVLTQLEPQPSPTAEATRDERLAARTMPARRAAIAPISTVTPEPSPTGAVVAATSPTPNVASQSTDAPTVNNSAVVAAPKGPPISFFLSGRWVMNHTETPMYAAPTRSATQFARLPQWSALRVVEIRQPWLKIYYLGEESGRQPGEAWVRASDTGPVGRPPLWASTLGPSVVWDSANEAGSGGRLTLPVGARVELVGPLESNRAHVRFPGDGQTFGPGSGWVNEAALQPIAGLSPRSLPWGYPYTTDPSILRIPTPYRSQIDGAPYEAANCGPTVVGMALAAFGVQASNAELRVQVQDAQQEWGDYAGSYVWALSDVVEARGLSSYGLYDMQPVVVTPEPSSTVSAVQDNENGEDNADNENVPETPEPSLAERRNGGMNQWTMDEIRAQLRLGRVVIPQVWWRGLPGREDHNYWGDHFIVITGMVGDSFLYNDPVDRDGVGYDRVITPEALATAMNESVAPGAAFAVGR